MLTNAAFIWLKNTVKSVLQFKLIIAIKIAVCYYNTY